MKSILKRLLPRALVEILRDCRNAWCDVYGTRSYSQEGEDGILARLFEGEARGFYVDVGAHHPKRFSNTYRFYRCGWRGINVDPNPEAMRLFRRHRKRDVNIAAGVSNREGELTYYMFNEPALNSFDAELVRRHESATYKIVGTLQVKVVTLASILNAHVPAHTAVDFLSVDVEGHDLNVLESNDWSRFRPRCVLVEVLGADLQSMTQDPVHRFLDAQGYRPVAKTLNTAFYLDRGFTG